MGPTMTPPVSGPQVVGWASSKKLGRDERQGRILLLCEGGWRVLPQGGHLLEHLWAGLLPSCPCLSPTWPPSLPNVQRPRSVLRRPWAAPHLPVQMARLDPWALLTGHPGT